VVAARPVSRRTAPGSRLRGLTGVLAGGLVALALALVAIAVLAGRAGSPPPRVGMLTWHVLAAAGAVGAQYVADRRPDPVGTVAALSVVALTAVVLGALWLV
jgi:4-amino-4-deoxy-L-arabinose transferase-like glycosyltransferase